MASHRLPAVPRYRKRRVHDVALIATGGISARADMARWPSQVELEDHLTRLVDGLDRNLVRAHEFSDEQGHGFLTTVHQAVSVLGGLDPEVPLIVLAGSEGSADPALPALLAHEGPILLVAHFCPRPPHHLGLLELSASLTREDIVHSRACFLRRKDPAFASRLAGWIERGTITQRTPHVHPLARVEVPPREERIGEALAEYLVARTRILGVIHDGAIPLHATLPDDCLHAIGVHRERIGGAALLAETERVAEREARSVLQEARDAGMRFDFGRDRATEVTRELVLAQCRIYAAILRLADDHGCEAVAIGGNGGLREFLPAPDFAIALCNDADRPRVLSRCHRRYLGGDQPIATAHDADEGAAVDAWITHHVHRAMHQPLETSSYRLLYAEPDPSEETEDVIWTLDAASAPAPSHLVDGWAGAAAAHHPNGGCTIDGTCRQGEAIWSRLLVRHGALHLDIGRATIVATPYSHDPLTAVATSPTSPHAASPRTRPHAASHAPQPGSSAGTAHAILHGITREQMLARHLSSHLQVVYADSPRDADRALLARTALWDVLGAEVSICGTRGDGEPW